MLFAVPAPDLALLTLLNQKLHCSVLDVLMPLVSSALLMWGLAVVALVPLALRHTKRTLACFLVILAVAGVSDFSTKLLKESFGRIRPLNSVVDTRYVEDGAWHTLAPEKVQADKHGSSYPSAHASTSMAVVVLAMLFWPGSRPWLILLPLLIGWSRVYLGKHFPTDVLAGWLFGLALAGFSWQLLKWAERRLGRPGILTGPPDPNPQRAVEKRQSAAFSELPASHRAVQDLTPQAPRKNPDRLCLRNILRALDFFTSYRCCPHP